MSIRNQNAGTSTGIGFGFGAGNWWDPVPFLRIHPTRPLECRRRRIDTNSPGYVCVRPSLRTEAGATVAIERPTKH